MMFMGRTPQTTSKVIIMKAIVYRLTLGSDKQFEIGEDAEGIRLHHDGRLSHSRRKRRISR
nr:MAG TPA: hypothetical protein [Caudoviricetes sp.]